MPPVGSGKPRRAGWSCRSESHGLAPVSRWNLRAKKCIQPRPNGTQ
ncbi:MAG: hypothetical protein LBQ54_03775 [Planctomycetaceae bacterium]|nr:hypothetical protein [Planctomycetaceae bacterium]